MGVQFAVGRRLMAFSSLFCRRFALWITKNIRIDLEFNKNLEPCSNAWNFLINQILSRACILTLRVNTIY